MWLSVFIIVTCVGFIGYMIVYKPEKLEILDRVTSPEIEYYATGFSKPLDESEKPVKKRKVKVRHEPPECLVAGEGPEDLECPKPHNGGHKYKNEERCRAILEKIYHPHKFPSVRPSWLKNPATKRNLEIDMYCHELKIEGREKPVRLGLERNGKQHYQKTKFHRTKKDVIYQFRRDQWKIKRCQELGVNLISVPYWVRPEELENYIRDHLKKMNLL